MAGWKIPVFAFGATGLFLTQCYSSYPTLVIEHRLSPTTLVRNIRFHGCVWPETIKIGQTTMPRNCLPGEARIYYEALDWNSQTTPQWTSYQTKSIVDTTHSNEVRIVLTVEEQEPDQNAPGPFGH